MNKSFFAALVLVSSLVVAPLACAEATVPQVTQAIQNGHLDQAQAMLQGVLATHPNSAEAQYLEARILAKQGRWSDASAALQKAQQLAPGMTFVQPKVLKNFQKNLAEHNKAASKTADKKGNWGTAIVFFLGLILLIAVISMFLRRRRQASQLLYRGGQPQNPFGGANNPYGPQGPGYPGSPMGGMPQQGGGLGSNLAAGIATGVGVGAGLAAGQALAGSLFGGHEAAGSGNGNVGNNDDLGITNNTWGDDALSGNDDFGMDDSGGGWD